MPSRPPPPSPHAAVSAISHRREMILCGVIGGALFLTALIVSVTVFLYRKLSYNRTAPFEHNQRRFSYSVLRRATNSFSPSTKLGHGGFGSVHKATLPSGQTVALKVMDSPGSIQGEREFHNELTLCSNLKSPFVISLLGFSSDRRGRKLVLVYELMPNRSLQDALLDRRCPELMSWGKRFDIAVSVAMGLEYLHHSCEPPVIHGDIKPSNVLLDEDFGAKIGDFGLARVKAVEDLGMVEEKKEGVVEIAVEEFGVTEEGESVSVVDVDRSPESCPVRAVDYSDASPVGGDKLSVVSDGCFESVENENGNVNGNEKSKKKERKRLDWWASLDEEKVKNKVKKNRKPREWWKEEFCEELSKKSKKKKRGLEWWQREEEGVEQKKRKSKGSRGSIDWWLDGLSGEIRNNGRRNSQDWGISGDVPKSGGISSTPSMRGTVCYIAPEYGGGGQLSEKCDVYSFGVLLLVLVAGRRPLQVTASPISEFERANLISWARQLAHNGRLLDLVDTSIHSLDKEQALLCITIALLCLQRCPGKRPSMKEVVGMLNGEADPPHLPFEFSPSPPSNFLFKGRKKARD
ncbi:Receptor-like serine/threonine-protein [Vigna angularis]|uniref:non-specific serine/threonine protein kinase n=1 Tax=Phaseolus angularis TaxID=3914 RepID=A0A8T0JTD4_PHAAN|nr:Receptor-like serine/threonine-protein [Vigna angularis]